ncbi:MAG: hypothetical protein U0U67_04630 [Chitinophagales bacterium]
MKFLIALRNVTWARHFFILVTMAIILLCLYIYVIIFGRESLGVGTIGFFAIIGTFILHLLWITVSAVIHFIEKEWKPAIYKTIFVIFYAVLIYYIYGINTLIFYGNI